MRSFACRNRAGGFQNVHHKYGQGAYIAGLNYLSVDQALYAAEVSSLTGGAEHFYLTFSQQLDNKITMK